MVALHDFAAVIQRHSLFVLLALVATSSRSISSQSILTAVESRETKTSVWWPIVECVFLEDVNKCLQDRSVRAIIGLDRKDDIHIDTEKETVKMPGEQEEGIFDMLGDLVSDGIKTIFQNDDKKDEDDEDDDVEEGKEEAYEDQQAESGDDNNKVEHADSRSVGVDGNEQRSLETGRTKKKIKKLVQLIKIIVALVLIGLKIALLLYAFGKLLEFKMVILVGVNTLVNVVKLLLEWKKGKDSHVVHYEEAHHEHIHDDNHFDSGDKGWLGGGWSRSHMNGARSLTHPHDLAFSAQKPLPQ